MAEPADLILPLLREMRAESATHFAAVENRLNVAFRHALSADSLLSKIVTGEFEERLGLLERRVREPETYQ